MNKCKRQSPILHSVGKAHRSRTGSSVSIGFRRFLLAGLCAAMPLGANLQLHAHEPEKKQTALERIEHFQKSLKLKIRNTFSKSSAKNSDEAAASASQTPPGNHQTHPYPPAGYPAGGQPPLTGPYGRPIVTASNPAAQRQFARTYPQNNFDQNPSANQVDWANYQTQSLANGSARIPSVPPTASPNRAGRPNNAYTGQQYPVSTWPQAGTNQPGPIPENEASVAGPGPNIDPAYGIPPSAYGTHLGGQHITATEHALRLKQENQELKARLLSSTESNTRLLEELQKSRELLAELNAAMTSAHQELMYAESTNAELRAKLNDLESEHQRALLETDRMLDSIRNELDDALMREIVVPGSP